MAKPSIFATLSNFQKVQEFHRAFEHPLDAALTVGPVFDLRTALVKEEVEEVLEAINNVYAAWVGGEDPGPDMKANLVKELCDLLYVVYGFGATFGVDMDEAFRRVHDSNMSKLVDGQPIRRADGKVMKPDTYQPPNMEGLCE